jgi:CDP-Glycerol:Poly(glycerophosphate) glycerophosphotransferase
MKRQLIDWARKLDTRWLRAWRPERRRILVNAGLAMEFAMIAPIYRRMKSDPRVQFCFTSTVRPDNAGSIFAEAGSDPPIVDPSQAAWMKFDAYLAADLIWAKLLRGAPRVQTFHGVAGKYGNLYDRPESSLREWDRLFFINQRRLNNFIAAGAIEPDSTAARLVGMPKADCLVDGSLQRDEVLQSLGLDPSRRTVLYAPTWTPYSSLNAMGEELVTRLARAGFCVIVKLHDNSRDPDPRNSGGVDWVGRLTPILQKNRGHMADLGTISPYLVAADVMISDHSSAAFEFLLLDRPLIRIEMPELIARTNTHPEYVALLAEASTTVRSATETISAVESAFAGPNRFSSRRKAVSQELFYKAGTATERAVSELYELMELAPLVNSAQRRKEFSTFAQPD